ncbi:Uncharacterised protein [Mycobacteroides abscessus subsp. abscessus]|nr:Uncharacterised protein [Mycobacteroides abscessus subsp. abscessus]SKV96218.1 Uncharacterised protein [Mycobacteroides abscessus subsp. abscessus]
MVSPCMRARSSVDASSRAASMRVGATVMTLASIGS